MLSRRSCLAGFAGLSLLPAAAHAADGKYKGSTVHFLTDWAPSYRGRLMLDAERIAVLLAEKQAARDKAATLLAKLDASEPGVPDALRQALRNACALLPLYTEGMMLCAEVCLRTRWQQTAPDRADRTALVDATARLERFGETLRPFCVAATHPHQTVMLLDYRRAADIAAEARRVLAG